MNKSQTIENPLQSINKNNQLFLLVKKSFEQCLFNNSVLVKDFFSHTECDNSLLLAVSGGVDSQVMMHVVCELSKLYTISISVVTVNHNIREASESKMDADLVYNYATKNLGLSCKIITIEKNVVEKTAKLRNKGIEESARFLRYSHIKEYAQTIGAKLVLFAHNKNDQLETLLQHFLQGAVAGISGFSSAGICQYGEFPLFEKQNSPSSTNNLKIFRPLLTVERHLIEEYANEYSVPFRTDCTNSDTSYLRNRIRHVLIPVLHENFVGWDTAVLSGGEKSFKESQFIDALADPSLWQQTDDVKMSRELFFSQGFPIRVRLLYKGLELAGFDNRVSYKIIESCAMGRKRVQFSGFEIIQNAHTIIIRKIQKKLTLNSLIITECGTYKTEIGTFIVNHSLQKMDENADIRVGESFIGDFNFPFTIRQKKVGDVILTAQKGHKLVKKIFSEWNVDDIHRDAIPIIENNGEPICIWGSIFGYQNWYVRENINKEEIVTIQFKRNI